MASKCKWCGAEVVWLKSQARKALICDPEPITFVDDGTGTETLTTSRGKTYAKVRTETSDADEGRRLKGYRSHWATCPKREAVRRATDAKRKVKNG